MNYLLDVNALIAFGVLQHEFHQRVAGWMHTLGSNAVPQVATCAITELGFVRVLAQAPQYGLTVSQARSLLLHLKAASTLKFTFIQDALDISHLPGWVKMPKQITDGHLVQLAKANGALLATLDSRVPGVFLIPGRHRLANQQ